MPGGTKATLPVLGVDLGGTKTALRVMGEDGGELARDVFPTEAARGLDGWLERTAGAAKALAPQGLAAVGVGAAGQVDRDGVLVATANVGGWHSVNLGAQLGRRLGCPGTTDNDAKVTLRAEMALGAAAGFADVFLVAVGTGIGGALAVDGRIFRGARGYAGEFGHTFVAGNDRLCGCGRRGHLETVASGTGIARVAAERAPADGALARELAAGGGARAVFAAAARGDAVAIDVLDEAADLLGGAIAGVVTLVDPAVVVLAGGVATASSAYWTRARASFEAHVHRTLVDVPWREAAMEERAGVVGACLLARSVADGEVG